MAYNPENGIVTEATGNLPKDTIIDGEVESIDDGIVSKFVVNLAAWKNPSQPAIQVCVDCGGEKLTHLFPYTEVDGKTAYSEKSHLGKFVSKYAGLPRIGMKVKVVTDKRGFGRIKLD